MKPQYMLDTNICIYIAKHQPPGVKARFERMKPGQIVMSVVTYGELRYGAAKSGRREEAFEHLEELVREIPVEDLTPAAAKTYGEIRAGLEKQGRLIGNNDLWIGAHCLSMNLVLATKNEREFKRISGLSVQNWTK